jgi:hypothetical protein
MFGTPARLAFIIWGKFHPVTCQCRHRKEEGVLLPLTCSFSARGGRVLSTTSRPLYPREKPNSYVEGSNIFRPEKRVKVTEIKQLCCFSTQPPFISTHYSHLWTSSSVPFKTYSGSLSISRGFCMSGQNLLDPTTYCTQVGQAPGIFWGSFIHLVVCLTTGPKPLPKLALHILRSRASSFRCEYPFLSLRSSSSFLRLLPCLSVTSITPFIFPSIPSRRIQFLRKMWPIWGTLSKSQPLHFSVATADSTDMNHDTSILYGATVQQGPRAHHCYVFSPHNDIAHTTARTPLKE